MKCLVQSALCFVLGTALAGCAASYAWRSSVPEDMRTIAVPTFRNESDTVELGAQASRQILREVQREGTFRIAAAGASALEVQGVIKSSNCSMSAYDRRTYGRTSAYNCFATAEVSVIDKKNRKVLINNRIYRAETSLTGTQDMTTAMRNASGRLADDLAQKVVNDILNLKW